jgi:hypothetical protein
MRRQCEEDESPFVGLLQVERHSQVSRGGRRKHALAPPWCGAGLAICQSGAELAFVAREELVRSSHKDDRVVVERRDDASRFVEDDPGAGDGECA